MHEQAQDAFTSTIRQDDQQALHDGNDLASKWDFARSDTDGDAQREFLGNTGEREAAGAEAGTEAVKEKAEELDPFNLPYVLLSETYYLPQCAGIYFVIENGSAVVYIGQSTNIRHRWYGHHHVRNHLCDPTDVKAMRRFRLAWLEIKSDSQRDAAEKALIQQFQPRLNVTDNQLAFLPSAEKWVARRGVLSLEKEQASVVINSSARLQIHENPAVAYIAKLSGGSRRAMIEALASIARLLRRDLPRSNKEAMLAIEWHTLTNAHVQAVRSKLAESLAPNTANKKLAALRGVLRKAWQLGLMSHENYQRAADIEPIPGERVKRGRSLSNGEMRVLFESCATEKTLLGLRDAAMLGLLIGGGLRRAEMANLTIGDWDKNKGHVVVRKGKGNKDRLVPLPTGAQEALKVWLRRRGVTTSADALICAVHKSGKADNKPISTQAVWKALQARAKKAGVERFSPHDLRRTYAGELLDAGADLSTVQKLMGHSDPKVTAGYDRRGQEARRRAADLVHVPFVKE